MNWNILIYINSDKFNFRKCSVCFLNNVILKIALKDELDDLDELNEFILHIYDDRKCIGKHNIKSDK